MTTYIEENILPGEKLLYSGHRHWVVFVFPVVWFVAGILIYMLIDFEPVIWIALIFFVAGIFFGIIALIDYKMSEVDVTTERILIKTGWIARSSIETDIRRISSIDIEQTVWGRILNYGTVIVCDVGNVRAPFDRIVRPYDFRRAVLMEIDRKRRSGERLITSGKENI